MERSRLTLRMSEETKKQAEFWANSSSAGPMSLNEFIIDAVEEKIARLSGYVPDMDNIVVNRLNELIDTQAGLSTDVRNALVVINRGFDSITAMSRGGNFLLDDFDDAADAVESFSARNNTEGGV